MFLATCVSSFNPDGSLIVTEMTEGSTEANELLLSLSTKSPSDPTMIFFTMDYGMSCLKVQRFFSSLTTRWSQMNKV